MDSRKINDVEPGDMVAVVRNGEERSYKVHAVDVRSDTRGVAYIVTYEDDSGGTFVEEYPEGFTVSGLSQ